MSCSHPSLLGTSTSNTNLQGNNPRDDLGESCVQQSPQSLAVHVHGQDVLPDLPQPFQLMQYLEDNSDELSTCYQENS